MTTGKWLIIVDTMVFTGHTAVCPGPGKQGLLQAHWSDGWRDEYRGAMTGFTETAQLGHLSQQCDTASLQWKVVTIVSDYPGATSYHSVALAPRAHTESAD